MYEANKKNNKEYGKLIGKIAQAEIGLVSNNWSMCERTNSTYVDCPIAKDTEATWTSVVHNPSAVDHTNLQFAVPGQGYTLQVYNDDSKSFEKVESTVSCKADISDKGDV